MTSRSRWDPCVTHSGSAAGDFIGVFFADSSRKILLIAGAGFDPRSITVCQELSRVAKARVSGAFVREERPDPAPELLRRAEQNLAQLKLLVTSSQELKVNVFASDGAVIGGRAIIQNLRKLPLKDFTDIAVDLSALSVGVAFPLVRYLFEQVKDKPEAPNLHMFITDEPNTDSAISSIASDRVGTVHGFQGGLGLDKNARCVKLWLPQLVSGKQTILAKIHSYVGPHEVCPILPFPAIHPRLPDQLIEEYGTEFGESAWDVDSRNLVFAEQRNPLDVYRTVLRIDDARRRVFGEVGGSLLVLSPLGSKAVAAGALMAAMERDFPIAYVEPIAYTVNFESLDRQGNDGRELVHVWLTGQAYPPLTEAVTKI